MDRRKQKTRQAIFAAFSRLLENKRFESITVQEIIDEANVGRSTFYAHFETKDELLKALCTDMFDHVFSRELRCEKNHDFSENGDSLQSRLAHLLYHLKDSRKNIVGIMSSESSALFMRYFKEYLQQLFCPFLEDFRRDVPQDFLLNYLTAGFAETVKWWIKDGSGYSPEEIARFYLTMTE